MIELNGILLKLGFDQAYINLVMKCVRSVRYKIKVNNEFTIEIIPERGPRQSALCPIPISYMC
jgi:hypothetical protein